MINQKLKRQDFAPILRAKQDRQDHHEFYTDMQSAWRLFNRMEIRRLVDRAVASAMSAFQLFETKEGIAIEAILYKMRHIQEHHGIKSPEISHQPEFRWEGWFYRVMKNAAFDVIPRFLFHHERVGLEDAPTPVFSGLDPELSAINCELSALREQEAHWRIQFALYASSRDLSPARRLFHLMLNAPKLVSKPHFAQASESLAKSVDQTWRVWSKHKQEMLLQWRKDNQRQINMRRRLCWLIYAPIGVDFERFIRSPQFKAKRDAFRQTAGRAAKDIDSAIALHLITSAPPKTLHAHRSLIAKALKDNRWSLSDEQWTKVNEWSQDECQNHAVLAAMLHTSHGDIDRWHKEYPTQSQNNITRFSDRILRINEVISKIAVSP